LNEEWFLTKSILLSKLQDVKAELKNKFGVQKLGLFGSFARDEANDKSDVDLLIDMDQRNYFTLINIENFLSKHLSRKVDIGFFDSMNIFIKNSIQKDIVYV
jgi:predicted nucleotidyltransferase